MNNLLVFLVFWLPGLALGTAIRLRGWTLAAGAPALTFGIIAIGIPTLGTLGIRWNLLNVALWTLALCLLAVGASLLIGRFSVRRPVVKPATESPENLPRSPRDHLVVGGGVLVGLLVGAVTFLRGSRSLAQVHQGWDAPFHANLVRWIAEHGDVRPAAVGTVSNAAEQTDFFYPDTYHALLALVFDKAGLAIPQLLNVAVLAVIFAVPLGVAALGLAWRLPAIGTAAAAAVCTWFTAFPYDSLARGPLWPYLAGVAMLPALLAIVRHLVVPRGVAGPIGTALAFAGLVGLHTSLAFVAAGYLVLLLIAVLCGLEPINWRRSGPMLAATVLLSGMLLVPLVLPALTNAAGVASTLWASEATVSGALGQTITFSPMAAFPQWWIGVPAIIGIFLMVKNRRLPWIVAAYVLFGGLFAATVSLETPLVHALTSIFYNDHYRIAALVPLAGAIAFGEFVNTGAEKFSQRLRTWRPSLRPATMALTGAVVIVLFVGLLSKGAYTGRNAQKVAVNYGNGPAVTEHKKAAFGWLAQHAQGTRVMNDSVDGSAWMYALAGVRPVEWTYFGAEAASSAGLLRVYLDDLYHDPRVRSAFRTFGIRYVILCRGLVFSDSKAAVGLLHLDRTAGFREVFRNPDAVVYEIEAPRNVP